MAARLQLLGRPAVLLADETIEPTASKISALLLYVACADGWVPREDLMFLLWPDVPQAKARNSLRQSLHRAARVPWAAALERDASRVRWEVDSDLARFRAGLRGNRASEALAAYGGTLLDGFRIPGAPEFDSWLDLEREELRGAWRQAARERAHGLHEDDRPDEAAAVLEPLLHDDPLDEAVLQDLLRALRDAGRRSEALVAFDAFAERLERELEIGPDPETQALADALRNKAPRPGATSIGASRRAPTSTGPLPIPATPFVGRRHELRELAALVREEGTRLLTLVAPGGMGKTRLALRLARALASEHADGAAFASFATIDRPSQMDETLADALGLGLTRNEPVREQLIAHLTGRDALLVLDNLEQLTDDLSLVSSLVERCPALTLVATSRERLDLTAETIFDLGGLSLAADTDEAMSDAAALFAASAERVIGRLSAESMDPGAVDRISRSVHGMPLALKLAAGWLRVLTPHEIADELTQGLDLLADGPEDAPERHRSVRAIFDSTWSRLEPLEREAWARLAVFEGPFAREAARDVAGSGLPLMLALVNKAILYRLDDGRFSLHPLLRRYGRERLVELDVGEDARSRHSRYHLEELVRRSQSFVGPSQLASLNYVTTHMPDIRAAWQTAATSGDARGIADAALAFLRYIDIVPLDGFGALCTQAFDALGGVQAFETGPPDVQLALERVVPGMDRDRRSKPTFGQVVDVATRLGDLEHVAFLYRLSMRRLPRIVPGTGSVAQLDENAEAAKAIYVKLGDDHGVARVDTGIGRERLGAGRYDEALARLEPAAAALRALGDPINEVQALDYVAWAHAFKGHVREAEATLERIDDVLGTLNIPILDADVAATRRFVEMARGNLDVAEHLQERYIVAFEARGSDGSVAAMFRSELALRRGRYAEARRHGHLAIALQQRAGRWGTNVAETEQHLARIELRDGARIERAFEHLRRALENGKRNASPRVMLDTAVAAAEALHLQGRSELAAELAAVAAEDPASEIRTRQEIERLQSLGLDLDLAVGGRDRAWLAATLEEILA